VFSIKAMLLLLRTMVACWKKESFLQEYIFEKKKLPRAFHSVGFSKSDFIQVSYRYFKSK